jgi:hypothetical protein
MGWILVFDMDQTITGDYFDVKKEPEREIDINPICLDIFRLALENREKGDVSAIFLLTNNSDRLYIRKMHNTLKNYLGFSGEIFDYIMDAKHKLRKALSNHPNHKDKSLQDIHWMCLMTNTLGKNPKELLERIIFFDDQEYHTLVNELRNANLYKNFIHVNPPYKIKTYELQNINSNSIPWNYAKEVLTIKYGGATKKRKNTSMTKKYRKTRRKQKK